jgi:O-acetyl-ADP-ribose deacetylase (regulator of RNase III)
MERSSELPMIRYLQGDATQPVGLRSEFKIIVHVCNDAGKWGKGFVLAVSKRWKAPELAYRKAFSVSPTLTLGDVQFVPVEPRLEIANLIGQHGVARGGQRVPPIRYEAIRKGLNAVAIHATERDATVHVPRMGCGLAGGRWEDIESIIEETLDDAGIATTVYDFD